MLLLGLLQQHVGLREFGLQQLFFQVSVFEDLLQVLEDNRGGFMSRPHVDGLFRFLLRELFGCMKLK